ncbi:hypothetical protein G6M89_00860 [Natronolimnobius sp. AArcel1]|uniref:hypothetical protein n=1 Tax=Natronolimnobius sp. AArcel1 TaxID=1679093 RepID=UPI0013ED518C|nr:hypothetical protein [Natronolimnobius sp. AArcel1]NGM67569.1 hypothetical protein [Natronolimnobius sp. AArcel1]
MATKTLEETDQHTIELDAELDIPIFTYNKYVSGEGLREIASQWEDVIESEGADKYVVNTQSITAHDAEDKQWLAETWIPNLIDHGVRYGAGVFGDSALASMDMEEIEGKLNAIDPSFEYRMFASESEALDWLAEQ